MWERAAQAAVLSADYAAAVEHAGRAREYHLQHGQDRAAARAQAIAGRALRQRGRLAEAREQLTAAVGVLRAEPDTDTVRALDELATLEVFAGSPDADRLTTEALILGQALDVGASQLSGLLLTRAIYLGFAGRRTEAVGLPSRGRAARYPGRRQPLAGIGAAQPGATHSPTRQPQPEPRAPPPGISAASAIHDFLGVAIGNLAQT